MGDLTEEISLLRLDQGPSFSIAETTEHIHTLTHSLAIGSASQKYLHKLRIAKNENILGPPGVRAFIYFFSSYSFSLFLSSHCGGASQYNKENQSFLAVMSGAVILWR